MKTIKNVVLAGVLAMSMAAYADGPQAMFGVSYTWGGEIGGGNLGISVKVISSREKNNVIGAAGVSYYPWAPVNKFGADIGAGYLLEDFAITGGWDFIQSDWMVSAGYVNTIEDDDGDHTPSSGNPPSEEEPESPGEGEGETPSPGDGGEGPA